MKSRNYLLLLLSLTLTGMPALAVDYVACREMLRTKNEMRTNHIKIENDALEKIRKEEVFINIPETECSLEKINYAGELVKCMENYRNKVRKAQGVKEIKPYFRIKTSNNEIIFYTEEGYKWFQAGLRVAFDMKKAGCPYE